MPTRYRRIFLLLALCSSAFAAGRQLLVISIDGLRPDYVLQADAHGLKIPHLRRILQDGAHATGVRGVLPTVTYPSHTTLMTGVAPAKHGIVSNQTFDPAGINFEGWYWYAEDIKVPTLWEAAAKAGLSTANVSWPVTVGLTAIKYNVPEYWRSQKSPEDIKLMRVLSTPGLLAAIAKDEGPYRVDLDDAVPTDQARTKYALWILRHDKPQFMTVHLAALDHLQHVTGPFSPESDATLEQIDTWVGQLTDAMHSAWPDAAICIVSDHGFARINHTLNLMRAFADAGLVELAQGSGFRGAPVVAEWTAIPKPDGGSAAVVLKDPYDKATRDKVDRLLHELAADPANGIAAVLDKNAITAAEGNPDASYWATMRSGFSVGNTTAALVSPVTGGTHGYAPTNPDMLASFFIAGPGIAKGKDLGELDLRNIAPTLAVYLGVPLATAELKPVGIN